MKIARYDGKVIGVQKQIRWTEDTSEMIWILSFYFFCFFSSGEIFHFSISHNVISDDFVYEKRSNNS